MRALAIAILALFTLVLSGSTADASADRHGSNCQGSFISVLGPEGGASVSAEAIAGTRSDSVPPKYAACSRNNGH